MTELLGRSEAVPGANPNDPYNAALDHLTAKGWRQSR
jgi:hypothetical protein